MNVNGLVQIHVHVQVIMNVNGLVQIHVHTCIRSYPTLHIKLSHPNFEVIMNMNGHVQIHVHVQVIMNMNGHVQIHVHVKVIMNVNGLTCTCKGHSCITLSLHHVNILLLFH